MKKPKKMGIVVFSLVFVSLIIIAIPLAGISAINTASATLGDNIRWDKVKGYEYANEWDSYNILKYGDEFGFVDKPLDELIRPPEEINEEFFMKYFWWDKEGNAHYKDFKIAPSDWAVWGAALPGSELKAPNRPIIPVDTDKDGKPEILMPAVTDYMLRNTDLGPVRDNLVYCTLPTGEKSIKYKTYYILDPSHKLKDENIQGIINLLYSDKNWKPAHLKGKDVVEPLYWKDIVGKTPRELGLDKYDRFVSKTPETPDEVPTGEEVTPTPGFEVLFAIAGLLAVAYVLRRRK
jgi:PGF-CTERM protein